MEYNLNELNSVWRAELHGEEQRLLQRLEALGCEFQWVDRAESVVAPPSHVPLEDGSSVLTTEGASFQVLRGGDVVFRAPLQTSIMDTVRRVLHAAAVKLGPD